MIFSDHLTTLQQVRKIFTRNLRPILLYQMLESKNPHQRFHRFYRNQEANPTMFTIKRAAIKRLHSHPHTRNMGVLFFFSLESILKCEYVTSDTFVYESALFPSYCSATISTNNFINPLWLGCKHAPQPKPKPISLDFQIDIVRS